MNKRLEIFLFCLFGWFCLSAFIHFWVDWLAIIVVSVLAGIAIVLYLLMKRIRHESQLENWGKNFSSGYDRFAVNNQQKGGRKS